MTTIQTGPEVSVPEVATTEEHHEAITASWELPAYHREAPPTARGTKRLVVGILAGAVTLAVGFGAGYWTHSQTVEATAPTVATQVVALDANGAPLGRRVAPLETQAPYPLPTPIVTDANGMPLGRRVAPLETQSPYPLPTPIAKDANGAPLGDRVPPFETTVTVTPTLPGPVDANGAPLGQRVPPLDS